MSAGLSANLSVRSTPCSTSVFLSEEEDKAWAERTDWDFAICGDYIKTNSGTSGNGKGGILRDETHNFQTLKDAPTEGYLIEAKESSNKRLS